MRKFQTKFSLKESVALVTGGAGLLGVQHCLALLEMGAKVILTDISKNNIDLIKHQFKGLNCSFELLDVTDEYDVIRLQEKLINDGISVDILINNAAINPKVEKSDLTINNKSRLENFPIEEWDRQLDVGLKGAFLCSKVFGSYMANTLNKGVIVNIASDLSIISPDQRLYKRSGIDDQEQDVKPITYSIVKTGLIGLTKYLATYWAHKNVRCNALSPGGVFNNQDQEFVKKVSDLIPMGRMANFDEYKAAIQFLCSPASSYMTGNNLVIDGGRTVW